MNKSPNLLFRTLKLWIIIWPYSCGLRKITIKFVWWWFTFYPYSASEIFVDTEFMALHETLTTDLHNLHEMWTWPVMINISKSTKSSFRRNPNNVQQLSQTVPSLWNNSSNQWDIFSIFNPHISVMFTIIPCPVISK